MCGPPYALARQFPATQMKKKSEGYDDTGGSGIEGSNEGSGIESSSDIGTHDKKKFCFPSRHFL